MSLALAARLNELTARIEELAYTLASLQKRLNEASTPELMAEAIQNMNQRIAALENRPKPGRPRKDAQ